MKVFVTGVRGQLGYDVVNELEKRGHEAVGVDIEELDITERGRCGKNDKRDSTGRRDPLCGLDRRRRGRGQCGQCRQVNANGTENIARFAKSWTAR